MPKFLDVPDEYLRAIGEVTVRWNHLEQILHMFLSDLLGYDIVDERAVIVFAHMAFPQKLDIFSALAEKLATTPEYPSLKEFKENVLPILKQAQTSRNSVIHSVWLFKDAKVTRGSISARGSLKFSETEMTIEEIKATSRLIEDARARLTKLATSEMLASILARKVGNS